MRKNVRYKPRGAAVPRYASVQIPMAVKGLAVIFLLCVVVRVFSVLGADAASSKLMSGLVSDDKAVRGILDFELGARRADSDVTIWSLILDSSILAPATTEASETTEISTPSEEPSASAAAVTNSGPGIISSSLYFEDWYPPENTDTATPNVITKPAGSTSPDSIAIINKTEYTVDTAALLKEPLKIQLTAGKPVVLIIHTHGSEAYMPDGSDQYVASDPYRTQDKSQSVIRIGDELASELTKKGITVIHDREFYDYPSYNGSYTRSSDAIKAYLKEYPSIKLVIDLHRDAIVDAEGNVYKTYAQVGDATCSQVMFVMGTADPQRPHPNWKENLKLALDIEQEMNRLYPSLAKPIEISTLRYNQQLTLGSMIVEVGSIGNTLQESLTAVRYFADAYAKVILGLYK